MADESKENTGKIGKEAPGVEKEIKDMKESYSGSVSASGRERLPQEMDRKAREAMEKTKTELEKLKKEFLKKYPFIRAIGILPPQGVRRFIEEEFAPEEKEKIEKISKRIHLVVIIPEDKFKKVKEIRDGLVKIADAQKQKVWIYTMSHVDVFGYGLDGKFEHAEASELAQVKNVLNVQVYLLTEFWEAVKDAHPVMFTLIRDGIPLHDRGTFLPWKLLLKMGKIKPSPEAVDTFMKYGDQNESLVKRRLIDAMVDIYWGVITPTQALMMLAGEAPPVPKTIVEDVRREFVEKEKIMSPADLKTLAWVVGLYKDYEHAKLNSISGEEIDKLLKASKEYDTHLKSL